MSAELAQKIEEALPMVTVGKGVDWTDHEQTACALSVIYQQIKEPKARHKQTIQRLRELVRQRDECKEEAAKKQLIEQVDKIKKGLPAFTASGTFPSGQRQKDKLIQHSGRLQIDVDKVPADRLQLVKEQLATDPCMEATFISPSGTGVKAVMKIPVCRDDQEHRQAFLAAENYLSQQYQLKIDPSTKDVSRVLFASYDQDLVLQSNSVELDVAKWLDEQKQSTVTNKPSTAEHGQSYAQKVLEGACQQILAAASGERHNTRNRQAYLVGGYVGGGYLESSFALDQLLQAAKDNTEDPTKATKDIENGFRDGQLEKLHPPPLKDQPTIRKANEQPTYQTKIVNGEVVPVVNKEEIFWQAPIPLSQHTLPTINLDLLPSWLGEFTRCLYKSTETPPELPLAMVLAACSTAVARRFKIRVKSDYCEPANLWLICALAPGNRKSFVQREATQPLLDWEQAKAEELKPVNRQAESKRKTQEARIQELRKKAARCSRAGGDSTYDDLCNELNELEQHLEEISVPPQLWTSDATQEKLAGLLEYNQERMAWLSSEGGVFDLLQGRYSNGILNLDLVLKSHSGDSEKVDRNSRPTIYLKNPLLTMGLSPQPDVLNGLIHKPGFRGRGLLGRFLYLLPESPLGYRTFDDVETPDWIRNEYHQKIKALLDLPLKLTEAGEVQYELHLSAEAYAEWKEFSRYVETQLRPDQPLEYLKDWAGKCSGALARLAAVLHVAEHAGSLQPALEVPLETVKKAAELMISFIEHSKVAFDLMGADKTLQSARTVWRWIKRNQHEQFTQRDCFNALRTAFPKMDLLKSALQILEERNYVQILEAEKSGVGRKPSPPVLVNPDALKEGL